MEGIYYPGRDEAWERRSAPEVGVDGGLLQEAIDFARDPAHEGFGRDLRAEWETSNGGKRHDDGLILGPMRDRGEATGVVLRHGYLISEWGEPERVDMTFSVSKSFLSTVAGLAWDRGMIGDINDPVGKYVDDGGYDSEHNSRITWDNSLRQTSEWEGTLWGKHFAAGNPADELLEPIEPGTRFEYNDVRVNRLSLSLLRVWKRPLSDVLRELAMDPIDASDSWEWHGYDNSYVEMEGQRVQSVSGGGHWGGGMWISARDQARFGYLSLRRGRWRDRQILSDEWIDMATTPTGMGSEFGFMNWTLNTDRRGVPSAPASCFYHSGAGSNRIFADPEHDLVVVSRWLAEEHYDGFISRVLAAVR